MNDFGSTLRRLRQERGLSLTQLSHLTNYSKGYLSKLELGERTAATATARVCDSVLKAKGQLLATLRDDEAARVEQEAAFSVLSALATTDDNSGYRFRGSVDVYSSQLRGIYTTLRNMGHHMSPELILPMALTNVGTANEMLRSARPGSFKELFDVLALIKEYAGWMAQERGQNELCKRLTQEAAELALKAGNFTLERWKLIRIADIALYLGDGLQILDLTRRTLEQDDLDARTRSFAWQRQAQGHALLGDQSSCLRALDQAQLFFDAATAADPQSLGIKSVAQPVEITRGWALVDLCVYDEAAEVLRTQIDAIEAPYVRSRARFTTRLALAYASNGDREDACQTVRSVLNDIHRVDSNTIRVDLKALAEVLRRRWSRDPVVGDVLAEMKSQLDGSAGLG